MPIVWLVLALALLSGCASSSSSSSSSSPTPPVAARGGGEFKPAQVRQPAVFVRFEFGTGAFSERERTALPAEYEGTLLDALNAKAVLTSDVRLLAKGERFDSRSGLERAREIGADHLIVVDVKIDRREMPFCSDGRRPFRVATTRWSQSAEVIRVSDGATRLSLPRPGIQLTELEPDCQSPSHSRQRSRGDTVTQGVEALLKRVVGP